MNSNVGNDLLTIFKKKLDPDQFTNWDKVQIVLDPRHCFIVP